VTVAVVVSALGAGLGAGAWTDSTDPAAVSGSQIAQTDDAGVDATAPEPGTNATYVFEAESPVFGHRNGSTVEDPAAFGGQAHKVDPGDGGPLMMRGDTPGNHVLFSGTDEPTQPGWYAVTFRMKVAQRTPGIVAALDGASIDLDVPPVQDLDDTRNWNLTGTAWNAPMTYQKFTIPVYLPISDGTGELPISETRKQFRVAYAGNASLWIDRVTVRRVDDDWNAVGAPTETASSASRARFGARGPDQYLIDATGTDGTNGSADTYATIYRERTLSTTGTVETTVSYRAAVGANDTGSAGLVVRNDLARVDSGGYVRLGATAADGVTLQVDRNGDGAVDAARTRRAGATRVPSPPTNLSEFAGYPVMLRLDREGRQYTGYYSLDFGATWRTVGTVTTARVAPAQDVGVYAASGNDSVAGAAVFEGLGVEGPVPAVADGARIRPPTDPDGDGTYEDVDGDGRASFRDVYLLFTALNGGTVRSNEAAFDFDGSGTVGYGDVVALFRAV
jgi:PKD repeat protein